MNHTMSLLKRSRALMFLAVISSVLAARATAQTVLVSFGGGGSTGRYPTGDLTLSGSTLYGMTYEGGDVGLGTIYSIPTSGGTPTLLATLSEHGWDAEYPCAGLTLGGSTLYGTASRGGAVDQHGAGGYGMIFSIPTTAVNGDVTTLASFNFTNGATPTGSLTLSGSTLYGTAGWGGANSKGTIFSIPTSGGAITTLASFNGANGAYPCCNLTLSGSTLYGMTEKGGTSDNGTIFSVPIGGGDITTLAKFNGANGANPFGSLTLSGSTLYGMTEQGGAYSKGTIFSIPTTTVNGAVTTLATFNVTNGANPYGSLTLSPDGSTLYGTTEQGGAYSKGTIFSIPISGGAITTLASFNGANGANPDFDLTLSGSTLYGVTLTGGAYGYGVAFSLAVPEPSTLVLLGIGAFSLLAYGWRKRRRAA